MASSPGWTSIDRVAGYLDPFALRVGGQHNDRDIGRRALLVAAHLAHKANAVLLAHHIIQNDDVDGVVAQRVESLGRCLGLEHVLGAEPL